MLDVTCSHSDVLAPALCNDCGATVGVADAANETYSGNDQIGQVVTSAGFVGRQREVGELVAGLEWAIACRGQVVMLAGDPGIGKTRAAQELASIADSRNAEVYWGHCYESAGAPPYWPWLQIIRSFVDEWDAERLDAVMGLGAQAIGEIVPELRSKLPNLESPQTFDPDSARFRLFDSITTSLKNASTDQPFVLILEDLHWADPSSLALLEHVAGAIASSNILVIGTYRDTDVSHDHPLSRTLGSLVRHASFQSLLLSGLSLDEVAELVVLAIGSDSLPGDAEEVHRRTEGNALFVVELLKLLATYGRDGTPTWRFSIPQEIRGVIGRRLSGLSNRCNQALTVASVIGREFDFDLLSRFTGSPDDDLLDVVDEAVEARVIEDMPGATERYRFSHALIEQTLCERQTTSRRARLHSRIGDALEDVYGRDAEAHASELVSHYSRSPRRQDLEKALRYGNLAANQAASVYAYGEAAAYLEQCLETQQTLDPHDNETRGDLLIDLGETLVVAGYPKRAFAEIAPEAFAMAEAADESGRAFRACRVAIRGLMTFGAATAISTSEFRKWAERAEPETTDRIEADVAMAGPRYSAREYLEAWRLVNQALSLAHQLGEPEYVVTCNWQLLGWTWPPQYQKELFEIARRSADSPVPDVDPRLRGEFLGTILKFLLAAGDGDRAWRMWDEYIEFVERTNIPLLRTLALAGDIKMKTFLGELESAVETIDRLIVRSRELGSAAVGLQMAATRGFIPLLHLGRPDDALAIIPQAGRNVGLEAEVPSSTLLPEFSSVHALCHAYAGRPTEAHENFDLAMAWIEESLAERRASVTDLSILLETAVLLKDVGVANRLAEQLEVIAGSPGIARRLGEAAVLSADWNKAQEYFHKALEVSINTRDRPETALSRFDMAELLLGHGPGQRDEAMEHLDFAVAEFQDMKMQPSLARALALKEKVESKLSRQQRHPDGLTRRETQVLRLIAAGDSNREIAIELVLSVRTVERHINNIYRKRRPWQSGRRRICATPQYGRRHLERRKALAQTPTRRCRGAFFFCPKLGVPFFQDA